MSHTADACAENLNGSECSVPLVLASTVPIMDSSGRPPLQSPADSWTPISPQIEYSSADKLGEGGAQRFIYILYC